jgi:exodeoxyribonuclease V gamma subunit
VEVAAGTPERGLLVFRASRLEALLVPLQALLVALPPEDLLAPHNLIAAHPGMRRWLLNALAREAGSRGIAANLEIALPGQWLDRQAACLLPAAGNQAAYAGAALRWRLLELLADRRSLRDLPQLAAYLVDDADGRRRWELAGMLAELYGRLLVYRPDWLQAWQDGHDAHPEPTELAPLWRSLHSAIGVPHRSEQHAALLRALRASRQDASPLHVFGLSQLPPRHLDALRAAAAQRLVVFYLPDPCVEHWAGLRNDGERLRTLLAAPADRDGEALYLDVEHPLLASLGRLGQQFGVLLAAADDETALDIRAGEDAEPPPGARQQLLGRLQDSIRRLRPALLRSDAGDTAAALRADASLRVHRCHSRLRELEVLRDALLRAFVELPGLRPAEVAVLAPRMADYAPLLGAVFGPPARADARLPYHTADLPLATAHPLLAGFQRLLALAQGRIAAADLLDLLAIPALRRGLGLAGDDVDTAEYALREAAAAWGLDGAHRAEQGVPALEERTLGWSLDRLCAGYVFGDEEDAPILLHGIRPAARLGDGDAGVLGALHRLLAELAALHAALPVARPASAWIGRFRNLLQLFRADPQDAGESAAFEALQEQFATLQRSLADAGCDPLLAGGEALAMLRDGLAEVPQHAPFLFGGITFCGMVPQRALPYRVIAVLGLDDEAFPRSARPPQFDPLPRHPRLGDRDLQRDDRYLFLETLMAVRERLHLSWVGEGARDGRPRNPSPVLAELLDLLDGELALQDEARQPLRPWLLHHPLQPFDPRYRPGATEQADPALLGYARDAAARAPATAVEAKPTPPTQADARLPLRQLDAWLRDPARELLRDRHQVRLDALDEDSLPDSEPLDPQVDARSRLWRQLLDQALHAAEAGIAEQPSALLRVSGLLPPGRPGDRAYAGQRALALALLASTRAALPWLRRDTPAPPSAIDLDIAGIRLHGELRVPRDQEGAAWLLDWLPKPADSFDLGRRLSLLLRWSVLNLDPDDQRPTPRCAVIALDRAVDWAAELDAIGQQAPRGRLRAALHSRLACLLGLYRAAEAQPLAYFPKTSDALLAGGDPRSSWLGSDHGLGERDYAPGYAQLLAGEQPFWRDDHPANTTFRSTALEIAALLDLGTLRAEVTG